MSPFGRRSLGLGRRVVKRADFNRTDGAGAKTGTATVAGIKVDLGDRNAACTGSKKQGVGFAVVAAASAFDAVIGQAA